MATLKLKPKIRGFSLIELAIVLLIIGLFIGGLLPFTTSQINQRKIVKTDKILEEIKNALLGFAVIHERLPCSDRDNDGMENLNVSGTACESNGEGDLPWKDLGVGQEDSWGSVFRYRTEAEFTDFSGINVDNINSGLRMRDRQNVNFTVASGNSRVAAVIFSYGKNGVADDSNSNLLMKTFVYDSFIENIFDDRVTWLSINIVLKHLIITGKLPP